MQLRTRLPALIVVGCVAGLCSLASAQQEDGGAWRGAIEPRLNYYWETSTRVVVPSFEAQLDAPFGLHIGAGYLVDAITSASIAQTGSDEDKLFTEYRHGANLGLVQDIAVGSNNLLQLGVHGTYSTENDYKSVIYGGSAALTFNDKATRALVAVSRVEDDIRSNADPEFRGELSGITVGTAIEHALNPVMLLTLGYQIGYLEGYLGNPYRRALRGPLPIRETPPDTRVRHTAMAHWAWFLPETLTAVHLLLSAYTDSWEIDSITPEVRLCQTIDRNLMLRPHYRFYYQDKAWFQVPGAYPADWTGPLTNDPKMEAMTTHTVGLTIEYQLAFLAQTFLDFGKRARLDLTLDRFWSTSRYGNGIIGTAGARVEF